MTGRALSEEDAEAHIHGISFKTGPPAKVGAELEWLVRNTADPAGPVDYQRVCDILKGLDTPGALPGGGSLTREPGGQVEVSTAPAGLGECVAAASRDLDVVRQALQPDGLALQGRGLDPLLPPRRVLDVPRYAAMEEYFGRRGPWGEVMMCSTASVQVCVDAGTDGGGTAGYRFRWQLLHAVGPVLVAMFANSPLRCGRPTGWKCTRQLVWSRIDPCRTWPPAGAEPWCDVPGLAAAAADPAQAWVSYALDAELMCLRRPAGQPWTAPAGLTFRGWLRGAAERRPTVDDLRYHLSTLFPPVRPRGHLELRVIDAQPGDGWIVPTAVVQALLDDPAAADATAAAAERLWRTPGATGAAASAGRARPLRPGAGRAARRAPDTAWPGAALWRRAARLGLADPELAAAARRCLEIADAALARSGTPAAVRKHVSDFAERYALRGRCPADDLLEASA